MKKLLAILLCFVGAASVAMAMSASPEIDPSSAGSALTLIAGTVLLFRGRRRK
jgi:opacity protein-like surface antigen